MNFKIIEFMGNNGLKHTQNLCNFVTRALTLLIKILAQVKRFVNFLINKYYSRYWTLS